MVSIIIVTFNTGRTIRKCIESVLQNMPADSDVIIVDNGSTDDTLSIVREYVSDRLRLIVSEKNVGFGGGNNIGMRASVSDLFYLHNGDAYLTPDALDELREAVRNRTDVGIAGPSFVYPDGSPQNSAYAFSSPLKWTLQIIRVHSLVRFILKSPFGAPLRPLLRGTRLADSFLQTHTGSSSAGTVSDVDWITGAGMLLTRAAFEATKGFDEDIFLYSEDEDLCRRCRAEGFHIVKVTLTHPIPHELGWSNSDKKKIYSSLKYNSKKYFIKKHFNGLKRQEMLFLLYLKKILNVD